MQLLHFELLKPICPVCLLGGASEARLRILHVERGDSTRIVEGALSCSSCKFEYPILDGIPLIMANVREVVRNQLPALLQRTDVSPYAASFLADCAGPDSVYERDRYRIGAYAHAHWADASHGASELSRAALALAPAPNPSSIWLDVGCSLGRSAVELVRAGAGLVAALDLNLGMLRAFADLLATGTVRYDLRRVGVVYDRREIAIELPANIQERIAVWACDATALPFAQGIAQGALSLNLIDCMAYPINHLSEVARVLDSGGHALIASPFDWSSVATPFESWIGGHTQRGPMGGSSQAELERILGPQDPGNLGLRCVGTGEAEWAIHVHERATMRYRTFLAAARKL